jgi:lipooligosaccharide transport system ATP-binding protein
VKRFGDLVAVDGVDFDLQRGEVFGFLGPNGAGKTSTMRMIGCVSPVTDGTLRVFGLDPARDGVKIRGRLGVVPQLDTLDMELTVRENIVIYGRYFGLPRRALGTRADELLEFVQLTERANDKVEPLSGGMKRRLTIARSLVNDPEVMLLDEPTTGLDPQARHVVWDRLYRLKQSGVTLVLTTHYMDEAEVLCDRVAIMDRGRILQFDSPAALIRGLDAPARITVAPGQLTREDALRISGVDDVVAGSEGVVLTTRQPAAVVSQLADADHLDGVRVQTGTLEDVFLDLTGREYRA